MPNTTNNNNRPIATKGSDHVAAATEPDVHYLVANKAKKVPFPNTVPSKLLKKGATTKTFIGKQPIWTEIGEVGPLSDPDHAHAQPGVKSGTYRMEAKATSWSRDVFAEGNAVIRTYDTTTQNHANTFGLVLPDMKSAQLADPTLPLKLPADCALITGGHGGTNVVPDPPAKQLTSMRNRWAASGGAPIQHTFPGDTAPRQALQFFAHVGGRTIPVIVPRHGTSDTGRQLPTPNQIAQALAVLPPPQLAAVGAVEVSPRPNPHDAHWQTVFNDPNHVSAATAGNPITFYPAGGTRQSFLDATLIHEAGHNVHNTVWTNNPATKAAWNTALVADGVAPSGYAGNAFTQNGSMSEDFAETLVIYSATKNTPCEAYARRVYPNRFRELDKLFKPAAPAKPRVLTGNNPAGTR